MASTKVKFRPSTNKEGNLLLYHSESCNLSAKDGLPTLYERVVFNCTFIFY